LGMKIFLIGFMGVGKSTLGKRLAAKLGYTFIDSDKFIEDQEEMSVSEIFEKNGEEAFRDLELLFLKSELDDKTVIALGGGTPCYKNNMNFINQLGISVYLDMHEALLTNRLMHAKGKRPLIEAFKNDEHKLKGFIEEKLKERRPFYDQAHIKIDASNFNASKLDALIEMIQSSEQSHS